MGHQGEIIDVEVHQSGGVGSLDLDRRPWLDRPWSDELRDERLGPRPCSSPLTDREWAVLLSLFAVRGRLLKSRTALLVSRGLLRGLTLCGGGRCGGVLGPAARLPPLPGLSRVPPDLDSSDSSLRSDDDSIRGRFAMLPPRSGRRLPRPRGQGVLSTTVSLSRALLHESRPVVVSSDPESKSLDLICVNDPGSSPSVCVISPSSYPEPSCSLPARSDSVGVTSQSGVVPLMSGRRMVDGGPGTGEPRRRGTSRCEIGRGDGPSHFASRGWKHKEPLGGGPVDE